MRLGKEKAKEGGGLAGGVGRRGGEGGESVMGLRGGGEEGGGRNFVRLFSASLSVPFGLNLNSLFSKASKYSAF